MGLSTTEQETSVNIMRDSDECTIYTTDSTMMTRLDKLVKSPDAPHWKLKQEHRLSNGELVGKTYITHKKLISFRSDIQTREFTPEQREAAATRLRKWQEEKQRNTTETTDEI